MVRVRSLAAWFALLCSTLPLTAQLVSPGAEAPIFTAVTPEWQRLERLKPGTSLVVDAGMYPIGPQGGERCRLLEVNATNLTCQAPGHAKATLVFPAGTVAAVYRERHRISAWTVVGLTGLGLLVGGLAALDASVLGLGLILTLAWIFGSPITGTREDAARRHDELIYLRPPLQPPPPPAYFPPAPAPATPFGASTP